MDLPSLIFSPPFSATLISPSPTHVPISHAPDAATSTSSPLAARLSLPGTNPSHGSVRSIPLVITVISTTGRAGCGLQSTASEWHLGWGTKLAPVLLPPYSAPTAPNDSSGPPHRVRPVRVCCVPIMLSPLTSQSPSPSRFTARTLPRYPHPDRASNMSIRYKFKFPCF